MGIAEAKRPCVKLSDKICGSLGKKAFICMTYKAIALHGQVDQSRCKRLMTEGWKERKQSLKRAEGTLQRMTALGQKSGPMGQRKVRAYKKAWVLCTTARMLKGAPAKPAPCVRLSKMFSAPPANVNKYACRKLVLLACRDLGAKAFYCRLFAHIVKKSAKIKPEKCQLIVSQWGNSQLPYYRKREAALNGMAAMVKKSKNPKMLAQYKKLRNQEMFRVYTFLHK